MLLWYIYRASKLNNRPASQKSTRPPCKTRLVHSVPNLASVPNLDDASGHKAITIKKLRNHFKLNSIKAKLKQTTTVAIHQLVAQHEKICCVTSCKFDEKRGTKPKLVAQSRPALYFSRQLPSTCIKGSTNIFVARQVDHAR